MNNFDLKSKTAIITGGAQGFGLDIAKKFLKFGAQVRIWDIDENELKSAVNNENNKNLKYDVVDVTNFNNVEHTINTISKDMNIDILINSAGITGPTAELWNYKLTDWKKVIDVNLTSTFLLSKYSIKNMLKNKFGRVVKITSIVGHTGNLGQSNYSASKSGIIGMSKSLAIEYAKKNITVNCVSPGFIVSDMTEAIAEKVKLNLISRIPMAKLGTAEDVSNCVAFLSSDSASYVTGEIIHVNGGMYMS